MLRCDFACEDFFRGNISGELHGHSWTHGLEADIKAPGKHRSNTNIGSTANINCEENKDLLLCYFACEDFFFAENIWEELYGHSWTRT